MNKQKKQIVPLFDLNFKPNLINSDKKLNSIQIEHKKVTESLRKFAENKVIQDMKPVLNKMKQAKHGE